MAPKAIGEKPLKPAGLKTPQKMNIWKPLHPV